MKKAQKAPAYKEAITADEYGCLIDQLHQAEAKASFFKKTARQARRMLPNPNKKTRAVVKKFSVVDFLPHHFSDLFVFIGVTRETKSEADRDREDSMRSKAMYQIREAIMSNAVAIP